MIGGEDDVVERLYPLFGSIAPGVDAAERTPGRTGDPSPSETGFLHCGPNGAGHFVKMVHNGIEYGIMAAYAEGLNILHRARTSGSACSRSDAETAPMEHPEYYQYDIDTSEVTEVWRRGSVIASWLLDLTARGAARVPDARRLLRPGVGLGRGALDVDRGDRRGRAGAGADHRAVLALRLARARRLRQQGAVGDALWCSAATARRPQADRHRPDRAREAARRRGGGAARARTA